MKKILLGGSPCTHWSIAQKKSREVTAEGTGWELFKNYVIVKNKFKPDLFFYENNWSISKQIKDQIQKELGFPTVRINSRLFSAQSRDRLYVFNWDVDLPDDCGLLMKDILESGFPFGESNGKSYCLTSTYYKGHPAEKTLLFKERSLVIDPIRIGTIENSAVNQMENDSRPYRVYSPDGKGVTLCGQAGGIGAKTGLYAVPYVSCSPRIKPVYHVRDGEIEIKGTKYPTSLNDGDYIIRNLSVKECCRLQGLPDWWFTDKEGKPIISNTQAYKGLGNGWQLDTVKYILEKGLSNIPRDEKILCLSMYDGIGTGRRVLEELGFTDVEYHAYEIDPYCVKLTQYRYPDMIHHGDAFQVRNHDWKLN